MEEHCKRHVRKSHSKSDSKSVSFLSNFLGALQRGAAFFVSIPSDEMSAGTALDKCGNYEVGTSPLISRITAMC